LTDRPSDGANPAGAKKEEVEVKLVCLDLAGARERLRQSGAEPVSPAHAESNDLYDDPDSTLKGRGCTLRLRQAEGEAILTYKGPAHFENGVRRREEREIRVSSAEETDAILRGLGMRRLFRYEKRREEWKLDGCLVALDDTPIGRFVEVEGDPSAIRRVVGALELDFADAIPYSYPRLYQMRREKDGTLPPDMVFPAGG
jgi:adenylate cyclase class 2